MRCSFLSAVLLFTLIGANALVAAPPGVGLPSKNKAHRFEDVADLSIRFDPPQAKPGQVVTLKVTIAPKDGAYTYPLFPPPEQLGNNTIELPKDPQLIFIQPFTDPNGFKEKPSFDGTVELVSYKPVTWEAKAVLSPKAEPGIKSLSLKGSRLQACNATNCIPTTKIPDAELEVLSGPPVEMPPEHQKLFAIPEVKSVATTPPLGPDSAAASTTLADRGANSDGLLGLLITAAFWGFVSLVTPCVFPMIPITVSLFLKQSQQSSTSAVKLATVYCLTIVLVLGAAAAFLLPVFKALSVNPYTNILLGLLLFFFSLSLFGMFDIALPGFLLRYAEKGRASGGMIGTVFGAVAFSIVSFTCVAPFLGGFAGMAASGQFTKLDLVLAGIMFAVAFASPFFVLALFPSWLKKLPKSGGWLDTIKAVMGFLELAAAFKFFRTAELVLLPKAEFFTYDVCMVAWVVIAGACGLYLLNLFRLPHDEERPNIGVLRLIFALAFLGLATHLTPAMFKTAEGENQRPNGVVFAWVDSFLLPEPSGDKRWKINLDTEVARIAQELRVWEAGRAGGAKTAPPPKRFIFVDFTGVTCTNCKLNERDVFPRPEVKELMDQYTLVALYTDIVPKELFDAPVTSAERTSQAKANEQFQLEKFGTVQLPLYVIIEPLADGTWNLVEIYDEGKINDVPGFIEFLKKPLG